MVKNDIVLTDFNQCDFSQFLLPLITVYNSPEDYPDKIVARIFDIEKPTPYIVVTDHIEFLDIPQGKEFIPREKEDDPSIIGVWL
ncbi:hypothetical protein BKP35_09005 [Anaerobacillus arseniciselenatis]|uniref:Uncharacterized protein n=1 Tax=Anaerobacillus arseniciselenatis TaxID=85682 RepID=A0A1S2LMM3_9BACI|nr:hypothetical protein [Anaerobacillus arseniciselenatis]OIJ13363.1 hypothetical protein BKP35_09005 [Anaerobacillus arseniciselenatis]